MIYRSKPTDKRYTQVNQPLIQKWKNYLKSPQQI